MIKSEEFEEPGEEPERQERGDQAVKAVEPPASSPVRPAQAEDAGGHQRPGEGGLHTGQRDQVPGHVGLHLTGVDLLDQDLAAAHLGPEPRGEGSDEVLGGGVLREVGHHVEAGGGADVDHSSLVELQHPRQEGVSHQGHRPAVDRDHVLRRLPLQLQERNEVRTW